MNKEVCFWTRGGSPQPPLPNSAGKQLAGRADEAMIQWLFRPPPWGIGRLGYEMCARVLSGVPCHLGDQCSNAHSSEELEEWTRRYDLKQRGSEAYSQLDNSYIQQIHQQLVQAESVHDVMRKEVNYAQATVTPQESVVVSKESTHHWAVTVASKVAVQWVALLENDGRTDFSIVRVSSFSGPSRGKEYPVPSHCQEWRNSEAAQQQPQPGRDFLYCIKVVFSSCVYGTFSQKLVLDFGVRPILVQSFKANVVPDPSLVEVVEKEDALVCGKICWSNFNSFIIPFQPPAQLLTPKDVQLLVKYPPPRSAVPVDHPNLLQPLSTDTYQQRFHTLLLAEEWSQRELLSKYNIETELQFVESYWLTGMINTAKFCIRGELFAQISLHRRLTEDTAAGRIILSGCNSVLFSPKENQVSTDGKRRVHEAVIEGKCKDVIYLRISSACVEDLNLKASDVLVAEIQFQLDRLSICELHNAVDTLPTPSVVFPNPLLCPSIPWTPQKQWCSVNPQLNIKQKEAVLAMLAPLELRLPPLLLVGPYGTGKTFTLAQGIKHLLEDNKESRILVCTHSNSAADLYVKDYLHKYVESGLEAARPLRVFYRLRRVETVNATVLDYSLLVSEGTARMFRDPTAEEVAKHRVVIVTLATSRILTELGLPKGFFTHIVLDEAAQVMECEAILPFALFTENTRVILAGDHMQLSPEVHSSVAHAHGLQVSLLERLFDLYPANFPCTILLCENYRSHEAIVRFTSKLFYQDQLRATAQLPVHPSLYPLSFFVAKGEEVQDSNSTAYYNNAEVYEVVERVAYFVKTWPKAWGSVDGSSIGVVTPYADQVFQLRSALRQEKLGYVNVERVLNIQGKQFRVIVLSTVRTRHTCTGREDRFYKDRDSISDASIDDEEQDFGFLSNVKLLITAMTRAQSLVAVVGDPIALCSIGKCRKLWEYYLETCQESGSLIGTSLQKVRVELENLEVGISSSLNPKAAIFIPRDLGFANGLPPAAYQRLQHQQQQQFIRNSPIAHLHQQQQQPAIPTNLVPMPTMVSALNSRYDFATASSGDNGALFGGPARGSLPPPLTSDRRKTLHNGMSHLLQNGEKEHIGRLYELDRSNFREEVMQRIHHQQQQQQHPMNMVQDATTISPSQLANLRERQRALQMTAGATTATSPSMSLQDILDTTRYGHPTSAMLPRIQQQQQQQQQQQLSRMEDIRLLHHHQQQQQQQQQHQQQHSLDSRETPLRILQHDMASASLVDALHLQMVDQNNVLVDHDGQNHVQQHHHQHQMVRRRPPVVGPDSSQCNQQLSYLTALRGLSSRPSTPVHSVLDEFEQRVAPRANPL